MLVEKKRKLTSPTAESPTSNRDFEDKINEVVDKLRKEFDEKLKEIVETKDPQISELRSELERIKETINETSIQQVAELKDQQVSFAEALKKNESVCEKMSNKCEEIDGKLNYAGISQSQGVETENACRLEFLEQYGRRDCLRFYGLFEDENENTNEKIICTAEAMGIRINENDISISHRLSIRSRRQSEPRPIIVKFIRRDIKNAIYQAKHFLKRSPHHFNVYVREHLTKERSRAIFKLKNENYLVNTFEGRLYLKKDESTAVINNLMDLCDKVKWPLSEVKSLLYDVNQ